MQQLPFNLGVGQTQIALYPWKNKTDKVIDKIIDHLKLTFVADSARK